MYVFVGMRLAVGIVAGTAVVTVVEVEAYHLADIAYLVGKIAYLEEVLASFLGLTLFVAFGQSDGAGTVELEGQLIWPSKIVKTTDFYLMDHLQEAS